MKKARISKVLIATLRNEYNPFRNKYNQFRLHIVIINPFSAKRKRPPNSRFVLYTRDVLRHKRFEIGEYTYGIPRVLAVFPNQQQKLKIGKFCSIADGVRIWLAGKHRMDLVSTYPFWSFPEEWPKAINIKITERIDSPILGDVIIGNDVWIGAEAMILPETRIGDGAVVGARSVFTRDVEPYSIVAGNPARLIRKRFDEQTIQRLLATKWWDWPTDKIRQNVEVIGASPHSDKLFSDTED